MAIDFKNKMHRNSVHADLVEPAINTNINNENNIKNDINNNINIDIMKQKPKYTDTHKATMVYIEADLSSKLDQLCKGRKGLKSQIINEALKQYLKLIQPS